MAVADQSKLTLGTQRHKMPFEANLEKLTMKSIQLYIIYTLNKLLKYTLINRKPSFIKTLLLKQSEITLHIKIQNREFLKS